MGLKLLLVGIGGGAGAIARYLIGDWVQGWAGTSFFPWGTALINITGCLLIGVLGGSLSRGLLSRNAPSGDDPKSWRYR